MNIETQLHEAIQHGRQNDSLRYALRYAELNIPVFPCVENKKIPASANGFKDATTSPEKINLLWRHGLNIGTPTGALWWVLDVDPRHGGADSLLELEAKYGELPQTLVARTPSGGTHYFFAPDPRAANTAGKIAPGLDTRGVGGYVLIEGSNIDGKAYSFVDWDVLNESMPSLACAPEWLMQAAFGRADKKLAAANGTATVIEGRRNVHLSSLAGAMQRRGMALRSIEVALLAENATQCRPPLPDAEVRAIAASISRYAHEDITATAADQGSLTDARNAARLVQAHGENIRWVHEFKRWIVWRDGHWHDDDDGELLRLARQTAQSIFAEAASAGTADLATAIARHASKSLSLDRLRAMVELAKSEPGITISQAKLDTNPLLLGVENGVVDLRTGELRDARREDFITKRCAVGFDANARSELWEHFLAEITCGDKELENFLQLASGYSLTGDTGEQCFLLAHGGGANGKSTFLKTLGAILGDYAATTPSETLMAKRDGASSNDIARLRGARFVAAFETQESARLNEALVKTLTGGDKITARFLFAEFFEFEPQFKLWLAANHKPRITGDSLAIWRRVRLVPFLATIPPERQDKSLGTKLLKEASGILAWCVQGALRWQGEGLPTPKSIVQATSEYREAEDVIGQWLAECCAVGAGLEERASKLYKSYVAWCEENGLHAHNNNRFGEKLNQRGFRKVRHGGGNRYKGISAVYVGSEAKSGNFTYAREAIGKNTQMYSLPTSDTSNSSDFVAEL